MSVPPTPPVRYAVRFLPGADDEVRAEVLRLADFIGEENALAWFHGLRAAAGTLTDNPHRYPLLAAESRYIGLPTRRLLYQRTGASAKYLLFYTISSKPGFDSEEETQDTSQTGGLDGPRVTVLHVRHGARRPLGRAEGRTIGERFARGI